MAPRRKGKKGTLHYALEVCDHGQLTTLISTKGDLDGKASLEVLNCIKRSREVDRDNISPLQVAISLGHYNICKQLVEEGAVLRSLCNIPDPLCLALQKGHFDIAHFLIQAGADFNVSFENMMPIGYALGHIKCTVKIIKCIIDAGFPKNGIVHQTLQRTALHLAVLHGLTPVVKYLFTIKVDPNIKDKKGMSALHYAVQNDYPNIVKLLIKNGADVDCECLENHTPMFYAIATGNLAMVRILISLGADIHYVNSSKKLSMMPLHFAANFCQLKITQLLLEKGADINRVVPSTGEIALHSAARADIQTVGLNAGDLGAVVELLIKQGSNLKLRHKFGLTPLQVAIRAKNIGVAKILIMNGSELNNKIQENDDDCYTTFHSVAKYFDKELIKLCLDYGADCNISNAERLYPCHFALLSGMLDILTSGSVSGQRLINTQNEQLAILKLFWRHRFPYDFTLKLHFQDGDPPPFSTKLSGYVHKQKMLFMGLKSQQIKVVQKAIVQGADVRCCSTDIPFPLHFLASKGNDAIMRIFLSRGVCPNILNKNGESPLHISVRGGYFDCCKLLLEYGVCYNYSKTKYNKTPLQIAKEKGHTAIVSLLKSVDKYFKKLKKGTLTKLNPDIPIFSAVMNSCHKDGMTLLGRAVYLKMASMVEHIMKLRAEISAYTVVNK